MHLLVIGQTGQLARAIAAETKTGPVTATFLNRAACDLSGSSAKIRRALSAPLKDADAIIIAAAYTAVDQAESDDDTAQAVNGVAPGLIGQIAAAADIPVIHISTDYVFGGTATTPYPPETPINPINAYGRSKAAGEVSLMAAQPRSVILRTSWVYDATSKNFMTTMLRLAETRDVLTVVNDQIGRPTYAPDLARACLRAADKILQRKENMSGIFHVSNAGEPISWADFARAILAEAPGAKQARVSVTGIPTTDYPTPAKRPAYSVMDLSAFETTFDMPMPDWMDGLRRAMQVRAIAERTT